MISLSLLTTAHPRIFQHSPVRSSTRFYPRFNLAMVRSPPLRVYYQQLNALFRLASASPTPRKGLSLLPMITPRSIMQKVRRHPVYTRLRPFVGNRFQVLLTPLTGVLFTFPSRYWFTIGRHLVFSLAQWAAQIHTGFHVSRATQEHPRSSPVFSYGAVTVSGSTFQMILLTFEVPYRDPTTPTG